ncbi:Eco57I restriction-modification methylase domain-containing protein [Treponema parvum]|uniref:Eco57I restriction-modification methylase domain-containing protein n=1 Tax=Treponema parvum TaxID=138851 RepID=UPI001AEC01BF|nr:N-6 DNA methylase [Treponema parvum]QTQ15587.1 Eco57I restriction-modification methylase domain-containing protein [Treponema parvum]
MADFRTIFEQAYPGKDKIYEEIIVPIFTKARDLRKTAPLALAETDKKIISQAVIIAQVTGTFPITFADVEVQSSVHLKRNRVSIQNCIRKIMEDNTSALIFFHFADNQDEWRVSFAYRADTIKTSTSAKRYTYLCGIAHPCRTIAERFHRLAKQADAADITAADMLEAFSVEALSKEFFAEYKVFYEDFVQYITGKRYIKAKGKLGYENKTIAGTKAHTKIFANFKKLSEGDEQKAEKKVRDYIKKMMGRLVFIQFLQKKGWLGCSDDNWNDGDRDYLQHLFEQSNTEQQENFLSAVLNPLFFGMLNTNPEDRTQHFKQKGWDVTLLDLFGKVPYLNGGLFEEDTEDIVPVVFPAVLFGNPKQKETGRTFRATKNSDYPYDASCGLLDFFARYNFTIDETDPEDREVGVDPEMLGKIFENLLEDNKDKGAFYTPKEIVQYMCRESLIAYLGEETRDESAMRDFVLKHEIAKIKDKNAVLSALKTVKICDPAVGSGAFPMGMLNELFACRMLLEGDSTNEENRSRIKKEIVRENIYGVDIEKGAVDIARLRFWLAIIVDEKTPIPLPNLDYKIMQGNSLLESYEDEDLSNLTRKSGELFDSEEMIKELVDAINGYYIPKDNIAKSKIRKQIKEKVILLLRERQLPPQIIKALEGIDLHKNNKFFLWHTWFSDVFNRPSKQGFDIVIGNPPYIQLQDDNGKLAKIYKPMKFNTFNSMGDIYQLFYETGIKLLRKSGHLCYITSNKWMRAGYGESSRKYFAEYTQPKILVDLAGEKVFENATVDVNILLLQKAAYTKNTCALRGGLDCLENRSDFDGHSIVFPKNGNSWVILSDIEQRIKRKIEAAGTPLKNWDIKIYRGILTGCNDAFIISKEKRDELIKKCPKSVNIIRPILRGRDIKRYSYDFAELYLIATFPSKKYNIDDYPAIKNYLLNFGKTDNEHLSKYGTDCWGKRRLEQSGNKGSRKKTHNKWFELQDSIAYWDDFSKPKIIFQEIVQEGQFMLDTKGEFFCNDTGRIITGKAIKFLVGILNSKLFFFAIKYFYGGGLLGESGVRMKHTFFEDFPCIKENIQIKTLVDEVLESKNITELSQKIDHKIYELYGLTNDECDFIENSN